MRAIRQSQDHDDRVIVGANSTVTYTVSHPFGHRESFATHFRMDPWLPDTDTAVAPVLIEDDVFVGMNAIVLKGATIGG